MKFNTVRMSSNKVFFPTKDFNMCVMVPILDGNSEFAAHVLRQSDFVSRSFFSSNLGLLSI